MDMVFPLVPRQRCWVHKLRNVAGKLRKVNQKECLKQAKQIYLAANRLQATSRFRAWQERWGTVEPKAVTCLAEDIEALLTVFDVPAAHRIVVRTTNPIERCFREVRRRTRPMTCFNNAGSIDRIMFAVFMHQTANWSKHPIRHFAQKT